VRARATVAAVLLAAAALGGCGDDDDAIPPADPLPEGEDLPHSSPEADPGGIEVPAIPGTFAAPVPSLGFGIAVPQGWNATLLSDGALSRLAEADLAEPFFVEAARNVAASGAVFYAAGVDDEGRVAEIKIDVQEGADTDPAAIRAAAEAAVAEAGGTDVQVVEGEAGRVRLDFRMALTSADDGQPIDAYASELLVPDGDRLWSIIVTSETPDTQSAVLAVVDRSFVLD
jgi:hypothetical protein